MLRMITDRKSIITTVGCLFCLILFSGCAQNGTSDESLSNEPLEVLDIRVFSYYTVVVNGESTSTHSFRNYIRNLKIDDEAEIRIFFNENASIGMMQSLRKVVKNNKPEKSFIKVFSDDEMDQHFSNYIYIDRLSNEQILFNGRTLHPKNLPIALNSNFNPDSTTIYLTHSVSETPDDLISQFKTHGFQNIIVH